jgi:hypothetical protein
MGTISSAKTTMVLLILAMFAIEPANAQGLCPPPGTVIETSLGGKLTFLPSADPICNYQGARGLTYTTWRVIWSSSSKLVKKYSSELSRLWPLKVGKEETVSWGDGGPVWTFTYKVLREEKIQIPAGQFDTFVLEVEERALGNNWHRSYDRFWYSPEVGFFIKREYRVESGINQNPNPPQDWEATAVRLPEARLPDQSPPIAAQPDRDPPATSLTSPTTRLKIDPTTRLLELKKLFDQKLISPTEYESRRKKILDSI